MDAIITFLNSGALVTILALFVTGQIVARSVVSDIARTVACEILEEMAKNERLRTGVKKFIEREKS